MEDLTEYLSQKQQIEELEKQVAGLTKIKDEYVKQSVIITKLNLELRIVKRDKIELENEVIPLLKKKLRMAERNTNKKG